ncbi:MAG TPA: hypothetical protein VF655_09230 [Allosphingosinicella sp.]
MAINYGIKLGDLRQRRLGIDRDPSVYFERSSIVEKYEGRATGTATKYALGAMEQVTPRYTEISVEECERIASQLIKGLGDIGQTAEFRLQGSVPLNTHIRGVSDVDFLVLHGRYFTYDRDGPAANTYYPYSGSILQEVTQLRRRCESILDNKFPAVKVDTSGGKAIRMSGGSLRREIDVVPAHWFDSVDFQRSRDESFRGVAILDESVPELVDNYPFLHIRRIEEKDGRCVGGPKMAIRLLKNIKNDSDQEIRLSSYEVAGLMWHAHNHLVTNTPGYEMRVLGGTDIHLSALASDYSGTRALRTPDGTRFLIDEPAKFLELVKLAQEVSALTTAVANEAPSPFNKLGGSPVPDRRKVLTEMYIPGA